MNVLTLNYFPSDLNLPQRERQRAKALARILRDRWPGFRSSARRVWLWTAAPCAPLLILFAVALIRLLDPLASDSSAMLMLAFLPILVAFILLNAVRRTHAPYIRWALRIQGYDVCYDCGKTLSAAQVLDRCPDCGADQCDVCRRCEYPLRGLGGAGIGENPDNCPECGQVIGPGGGAIAIITRSLRNAEYETCVKCGLWLRMLVPEDTMCPRCGEARRLMPPPSVRGAKRR